MSLNEERLTHLKQLEAESIHIIREVAAEFENPVMLYSIGKDSAVMLHLALKAFYPAKLPFPLLHVDTGWKFKDMIKFRDNMAKEHGFDLIVHQNKEGRDAGVNPFDYGSSKYTDIMKTQGLKQALDKYQFDAAFGGARRDEEKSRAKERVYSFRDSKHRWDPKNQRPELWNIFNGRIHKGENVRVFPISNWTELDIWNYIRREKIALPSIYFSHEREVVDFNGQWLANSSHVFLEPDDIVTTKKIRYRTVGDMTCTAAVESGAATIDAVIEEIMATRISERGETRIDDKVTEAAMEDRKKGGYF